VRCGLGAPAVGKGQWPATCEGSRIWSYATGLRILLIKSGKAKLNPSFSATTFWVKQTGNQCTIAVTLIVVDWTPNNGGVFVMGLENQTLRILDVVSVAQIIKLGQGKFFRYFLYSVSNYKQSCKTSGFWFCICLIFELGCEPGRWISQPGHLTMRALV